MPARPDLTQVEKDKLEINPDFDFRKIAETPFEELSPNVIGMFKWSGVYHQLQPNFFMIRIVLPGGLITTAQFRRALELAEQYAQGELCITTRQTLQFHWIRQQDIYKILEGMQEVGVTTKNGCGDVTRNLVTCSMQGACPHETGDRVRPLLDAIATDHEIQDLQRNFPRKHKISVAGCGRACAQTLMNCQGWVPAERDGETGWIFHAGGGLGARPYLAKRIFDWVPDELALAVTQATAEAFRRHGDRRQRAHARLKVVVDRMGAKGFADTLLGILKERNVPGLEQIEYAASPEPEIGRMYLDGQETLEQRQPGMNAVRIMIPRSELKTDDSRRICDWADRFGAGEVMFTNRQNVEIHHVPTEKVEPLLAEIHAAGYRTAGHERLPDIVACVGTTECRMAVGDTPRAYHRLYDEFAEDRDFWESVGPLRINLTGCPNNCAHAWIADIGLRGRRSRNADGTSSEGFSVFIGGKLSEAGRIGRLLGDVRAEEVGPFVRELLNFYLQERISPDEHFTDFVTRVPMDDFRAALNLN